MRNECDDIPHITIKIDGEDVDFPDYPAIARRYCEGVVEKKWPECRLVILAAKRYLAMLAKAKKRANPYYFSVEHAVDVCNFFENLRHVEGNWGSDRVVLQPWQCFKLCAIFGFRRKDGSRLVRRVYEEIPRKTGKSLFAAGITLYCIACEGEQRPLGYIAAATEDQAQKVLAPAKELIDTDRDLAEQFGFQTLKKQIKCAASRGEIITISSVGEHQDGHNPHIVVLEELHAQKPDIYDVMDSAFGARRNPLMLQIGTAGRHASGLGYNQRAAAIRVLEGTNKDEAVFALIYTIDKEDIERCYDLNVVIKANPGWNVSIFEDVIIDRIKQAKDDPLKRGEFLRTRLNVWSNAGHRLIDPEYWEACGDKTLTLTGMKGKRAWLAIDLAKYIDMAAIGILVEFDKKIAAFAQFYIPESSPYVRRNDLWSMYSSWMDGGDLVMTPGGMIDIGYIREDVMQLCEFLDVQGVALDPWQGQQLGAELEASGINAVMYRNNAAAMSDPTYELLGRIKSKTLVHPNHPILSWNAMNVEGEERNDTIFPRKSSKESDEKIDGFVALVMANGLRMNMKAEKTAKANPYENKSFLRENHDRK